MSAPECDLACQTKIIINGGNVRSIIGDVCYQIDELRTKEQPLHKNGHRIIKILNRMEDDACKVQVLYLRGIGYKGPVGAMLEAAEKALDAENSDSV